MTTYTPASMAEALRRWGVEMDRPIINGMRRGLTHVRSLWVAEFKQRGVGRSVFGGKRAKGKKDGARAIIKTTRVVKRGSGTYAGGLSVKGLAALQETGGRTKAHNIGKRGKVLAFEGGGFARGPVKHPGSSIKKIPIGHQMMERGAPRIAQEIDKGISADIAKRGLS